MPFPCSQTTKQASFSSQVIKEHKTGEENFHDA